MRQVRQENYRGIEDELSSFEEAKVQKMLVKEGKIEVVENPRFMMFMMEARQKELERRQRQKEELRSFSPFPLHRHRSESHAAAAIQQPAVD